MRRTASKPFMPGSFTSTIRRSICIFPDFEIASSPERAVSIQRAYFLEAELDQLEDVRMVVGDENGFWQHCVVKNIQGQEGAVVRCFGRPR